MKCALGSIVCVQEFIDRVDGKVFVTFGFLFEFFLKSLQMQKNFKKN